MEKRPAAVRWRRVLGLELLAIVSFSWRFGMRVLQKANTTEAHHWRAYRQAVAR